MALSLSVSGPWPSLAAEIAVVPPAAARPTMAGAAPEAALDQAFLALSRLLAAQPAPTAGKIRAAAAAVRSAGAGSGASGWLASRVEASLDGVADDEVPSADRLDKARAGIFELESLLKQSSSKPKGRPTKQTADDATRIAAWLAGAAPNDTDPPLANGYKLPGRAQVTAPVLTPPAPVKLIAPSLPEDSLDKLGQRSDIEKRAPNAEELAQLEKLAQNYKDILEGPSTKSPGLTQSTEFKWANLDALSQLFGSIGAPSPSEGSIKPALAGTPQEREIADQVAKIEALKTNVQAQLASRDALAALLAVSDRTRDAALQQRRNGKDMLEFHKNFARLAAVMDMSLALNEINAAEKAIKGMQDLLNKRLAAITQSQQQNQQNLNAANQMASQLGQWTDQAKQTILSDQQSQQNMADNEGEAASAVKHFGAFQQDISALIAAINASDKGQSADAATEYQRRINLLPQVVQWRTNGNPSNPSAFSIKMFNDLLNQVNGYIAQAQDGLRQLPTVPVEFAAVLIVLIPGPAVTVSNPSIAQSLQILADRKTYWQGQLSAIQGDLTTVNNMLSTSNSGSSLNEFGDATPNSLPMYKAQMQTQLTQAQGQAQALLAQMDQLAADVNSKLGAGLPMLSGMSLDQLSAQLVPYASKVQAIVVPNTDTPAIHEATMEVLGIADLLPRAAHDVILWSQADGTIKSIDDALTKTLPVTQTKLQAMVAMLQAVLSDADADISYLKGSGETGQHLIDRKGDLLRNKLLPTLQDAQTLITNTLIPYQQGSIAAAQPNTGSLHTLFSSQLNLINQTVDLYSKTVPWSIATHGGAYGNAADAHAHIAAWRKTLQDNLNGYTDAQGHPVEGLLQYQTDIKNRQDPNYNGTETVYGELQPYSLPKKIAQYTAERAQRAQQINTDDAQINQIIAQIKTISKGKYDLSAYQLPTGVTPDAAGVAKVNAAVNSNLVTNLASQLTAVGNAANAAAGSGGIPISAGGTTGTVPSGTQPPITISDDQKIALLALDAARRLAPSSFQEQNPGSDSASYAIARFIYADAVAKAAQDALTNQIPPAQKFVADGVKAIGDMIADTQTNDAYASSNGANETAAHVYQREIAAYTELDGFLREAVSFFGLKATWDQGAISTINQMGTYYSGLQTIYQGGQSANAGEVQADQTMLSSLQNTLNSLEQSRQNLNGWLAQLNDPHESALNRVMENISAIQDKTRAVLEANIDFHKLSDQYADAQKALQASLNAMSGEQAVLSKKLEAVGDLRQLSPDLAQRIQAVSGQGSSWLAAGPTGPQAIVIPKSQFSSFLSTLFGAISADSTARDVAGLRDEILKNPMALAQLLPNSKMIEVGQGSDGFYLVYQTEFSTPGGLETSNQLTLGNVLKLWDNNVSLIGYKFESPPSDANAPFGDQGITAQVESLQGKNWVNYLDVTFHKFIQDIPGAPTPSATASEARMMVFDDFALMLADGKLYFGGAGFADFAMQNAAQKPYYYGGNLKASVKFTEIMSLNAEESALFAKDPRQFLQTVNLDFTGWNPDLDNNFVIGANGDNKWYRKDKVGVGFDLGKALKDKNSFKVDFYVSQVSGTDDINQKAIGTTIVKGFSFDIAGTPVNTTLQGNGELGEKYDTLGGRVSFELPKQGVVLSGEGKLMGDAETYFVQLRKKLGTNTDAFISYGSQYVGLNNRLTIGTQSTFTLGELWRLVAGGAAEDLQGGQTLKKFNQSLTDFFEKPQGDERLAAELKRVFDSDVGKKLISLDIGQMTRDLQELIKAGAILDNVRMRGMVGFVSNPVGTDPAGLATGGGFQVGTQTELTMTKSQKELIHNKILAIFKEGLQLQERLLELTKAWQQAMVDLVESRWDMSLAAWMFANADDPVIRAEAQTRALDAADRHRQALLRYNALTGRGPDDTAVLDQVSPQDLDAFCDLLRRMLGSPDRLAQLIAGMRGQMDVPKEGFNLMDWIPIFEKITFSLGAQLQDIMASQAIGLAVSVRLPIYDPTSKTADKALRFEDKAIIAEMAAQLKDFQLKARQEGQLAASWDNRFKLLQQQSPEARAALSDGIRQWRNGLILQPEMWSRFRRWYWVVSTQLEARAQAALKEAWSVMDGASGGEGPDAPSTPAPRRLSEGFDEARQNSSSWEALAQRSQAAQELVEASNHRFQKVSVDINAGWNLTATGVALMPAFGFTGISVYPILNVSLQPEELKDLSVQRHGAEAKMYSRLQEKVGADVDMQLFAAYAAFKAASESWEIYDKQLIPQLEAAQDGSAQKRLELDQARLAAQALIAEVAQSRSRINYLLGRPLDAHIEIGQSLDAALSDLQARLAGQDPLAASRDVLTSRVQVAQSVETIVDKNLKTQEIRVEPISLIGRSLGRLIAALSGEGMASPELVALAREQTLTAQRDLRAFDARVPVLRAQWTSQLAAVERELQELAGKTDAQSRLRAIALGSQQAQLKAMLLAFGGGAKPEDSKSGGLPSSFASLKNQLESAFQAEAESPDLGGEGAGVPQETPFDAAGYLRYYDLRETLAGTPVGKQYLEGWIEVRLRSAATPPEALIALAKLQQEKADHLYQTALSEAQAKADILLSRLRLEAALARRASGDAAADARKALERDFATVAAHLRWPSSVTLEDFMKLVPSDDGDLDRIVETYLREVAAADLDLLKRQLFQEGLPEETAAAADPLSAMQANLIAERMSYKGFTPLAAIGMFQGRWVAGAFLEAPDEKLIQKNLEAILNDALRRELENQDRLKSLSLMLHALMASVTDKVKLLEAERARVEIARRNLVGAVERARMGMGDPKEAAAAAAEAAAADDEFVQTVYALRLDFIRLITELEALGYTPGPSGRTFTLGQPAPVTNERTPRQELVAWWAQRLLDSGFEARQDQLLAGVSPALRDALKKQLSDYRDSQRNHDLVLGKDFSAEEKYDLLTKVDLDGRRRKVEATLELILKELEAQGGTGAAGWTDLMGMLRTEVESQKLSAEGDARLQAEQSRGLRDAYWRAVPAPPAVESAYQRLSALKDAVGQAREQALHHYLQQKLKPEDYVLKDQALEAYVKALIAYDNEVLKTFAMKEVGTDPQWSHALNALFGLQPSLERRRDMLRYGRGIVTIDAALTLGETRMQALRNMPEARDQIEPAAESLAFLRQMRERWIAKPESLPALYEVRGETPQWLTGKDLAWLAEKKRIVEVDGKRFLMPATWVGAKPTTADQAKAAGGQEIVAGVDARREELQALKDKAEERRRRERVDEALQSSQLAATYDSGEKKGKLSGTYSLAELRQLEREGKVLYFNAESDPRTRLHLPVHALAARWRSPGDLIIMVQAEGEALPAGTFPSLEALEASVSGGQFRRAEYGRAGVQALLDEASRDELQARRQGWLNLKLMGFAYALDKDGEMAAVYMSQDELDKAKEKAKDEKAPEHGWAFHLVSDLRLGLDSDGLVVSASGPGFSLKLGGGAALSWLEGEIWALEMDGQGRIVRVFRSQKEIEAEAGSWWIEDMEGKVWKQTDKDISPVARLKRYIDPRTGLPVILGRAVLAQHLKGAEKGLGANDRWAYMPWNWGNIILETPRGIIKTPVEMITGRDPNQEGYIGRTYMRQTDGGATVHRNALGKIVHFIDIFEILPDPVDRYYDPSQFPSRVNNDSPIKPGEWEHQKSPVSTDGKKDVTFGHGSLLREIGWAKEDLEDARGQIMGSFQGSVRKSFVESVRGRAGEYAETRVDHQTGRLAVENTLNAVGDRTDSDGNGALSATPDHIAVDTVKVAVQVGLGAEQQRQRRKIYEDYLKKLDEAKPEPAPADELEKIAQAELALAQSEEARLALRAAADAASPKPTLPGFPLVPRLYSLAAFGR